MSDPYERYFADGSVELIDGDRREFIPADVVGAERDAIIIEFWRPPAPPSLLSKAGTWWHSRFRL